MNTPPIEQIRNENLKIRAFIKKWQLKNDILNFNSLQSFNAKFTLDFNSFLNNNNFSEENINLFTVKQQRERV